MFERRDWRNVPSPRARVAVAAAIATGACLLTWVEQIRTPDHAADFGLAWFGARALIHGANPYKLVGPGLVYDWPWHELYPATAMVAVLPFAFLPQVVAAVLFVWISTLLLAHAVTFDGWHRLPLFLSSAFVIAARRGQWSPLLTAALCMPVLTWILAAKPNIGLALLAPTTSFRPVKIGFIGGTALLALSLAFLPSWPADWLGLLKTVGHMNAPIALPGGAFVLLALLRWRRPEARLILALACVPQNNSWYEALPLLLIPTTFRESLGLSLATSCGFVFQWLFISPAGDVAANREIGILMVAFVYLPATLLVLWRPNSGAIPRWIPGLSLKSRTMSGRP
jgi:hypothetical protein